MSNMTLSLTLTADGSGLRGELRDAQGQVQQFGGQVEQTDKATKGWGERLTTGAASVAKLGAAAAAVAAGGMVALYSVMSRAAEAASVQEAAEAKLGAVLRATGESAGYNLGRLQEMASGMQAVTTVGDEVILNGMALLGTFKEIRGEGFERATKAALDMSQLMGTDLNSAIMQVGKALNDPISNLSALTRSGIQFTDEQKELIQTLWETGDAAGAQNIILAEMGSQFGGVAEAARQTYGGMKQAAANAYGDMWEQLGTLVTQNSFFLEAMGLAEKQFVQWGRYIDENREKLMELAKSGVLMVVDAIGGTVKTLSFFHQGWLYLKLVADGAIHAIALGLANALYPALAGILTPLELVIEGLRRIGLVDTNPIREGLGRVKDTLDVLVESTRDVGVETLQAIDAARERYASWGLAVDGLRDKLESIPATQREASVQAVAAVDAQVAQQTRVVEQGARDQVQAVEAGTRPQVAAVERAEQEKARIVDRFNQDYMRLTLGRFEFERREIEAQAGAYRDAGADMIRVAEWKRLRLDEVNQRESEDFEREQGRKVRAAQDATGDIIDLHENQWSVIGSLTDTGAGMVGDTFGQMARDLANGSLRSIEDYWKSMLGRMLNEAINWAVDVAASWARDFFSGSSSGGGGGGLLMSAAETGYNYYASSSGGGSGSGVMGTVGSTAMSAGAKWAASQGWTGVSAALGGASSGAIGYGATGAVVNHVAIGQTTQALIAQGAAAGAQAGATTGAAAGASAASSTAASGAGAAGGGASSIGGAAAAAWPVAAFAALAVGFGMIMTKVAGQAPRSTLGAFGTMDEGLALDETGYSRHGGWKYAELLQQEWESMHAQMHETTQKYGLETLGSVVEMQITEKDLTMNLYDEQAKHIEHIAAKTANHWTELANMTDEEIHRSMNAYAAERMAFEEIWASTSEGARAAFGEIDLTTERMTASQLEALNNFLINFDTVYGTLDDFTLSVIASFEGSTPALVAFSEEMIALEAVMAASGEGFSDTVYQVIAGVDSSVESYAEAIREINALESAQRISTSAAEELKNQLFANASAVSGLSMMTGTLTDREQERINVMQLLSGEIGVFGTEAQETQGKVENLRGAFSNMSRDAEGFAGALGRIRFPSVPSSVRGYAAGGWVPGAWNGQQGEAGDTVAAVLTPGEAVIPRAQAQRHAPLINAIMDDRVGYAATGVRPAVARGVGMDGAEESNVEQYLYKIMKYLKNQTRIQEHWQSGGMPETRKAKAEAVN